MFLLQNNNKKNMIYITSQVHLDVYLATEACLDICVSVALGLICPRACLVLLNKDYLLFKSQLTSPASRSALYLHRPRLAFNQYQSSGEMNG